jgi:hypothetical protein
MVAMMMPYSTTSCPRCLPAAAKPRPALVVLVIPKTPTQGGFRDRGLGRRRRAEVGAHHPPTSAVSPRRQQKPPICQELHATNRSRASQVRRRADVQ